MESKVIYANGSLILDGVKNYTYDSANRLVQVSDQLSVTSLSYNGLGQRLSMDAAGVIATYVLDGDRPLTATSNGNTTFYLYGLGGIAEETNAWSYSLPDGTNTPRQLSDLSGGITLSARYTPWGDTLDSFGTGNFTFGYLGGVLDATTGLLYVGNGQYYDPETGRFLTRNVNPDSTNPYVPWNPIGAILGPLGLIALVFGRRKKGSKTGTFLVLLIVLGGVGMTLAACGPQPQPNPAPPVPPNGTPIPGSGTDTGIAPSETPSPVETPTPIPCPTPTLDPYIIPGLIARYENQSDFSQQEQDWIRQSLSNWGNLIGPSRFASLVDQGAAADGNEEYLIRYVSTGGAGHLDQLGIVQFGADVFAADNWKSRYRPDPIYQNQAASARISVAHEFAHVIFNGDQSPVMAFDNLYDENNSSHTSVGPSAEESLSNILAYMTEQGFTAPGIPSDLSDCVINNIIPYLTGSSARAQTCVSSSP